MFRFIIRGRNCEKYIDDCFIALQTQTRRDWCALVLIDPSTDKTEQNVMNWTIAQPRIKAIFNSEHYGVCRNMYQGLSKIGSASEHIRAANDDDIIVILDLDDYLYRNNSLEVVWDYYIQHPGTMATYGSFRFKEGFQKSPLCQPYPKNAEPRKYKWMASHLKTFKYSVVKHIPQEYFMHNGEWGKAASDLALMFCVMEIVGMNRVGYIRNSTYYYRNNTENSMKHKLQKEWESVWRQKIPLKRQF